MKILRKALEATYKDWLEIWRPVESKEKSITRLENKLVGGSICALSQSGGGPGNQTTSFNLVEYGAKLFVPPEVEIRKGDVLQVARFGKETALQHPLLAFEPVGESAKYQTHQEVFVAVREKA